MTSVVAEEQVRRGKLLEEFKLRLRELGVIPFFSSRDVALLQGNSVVLKSGVVIEVVDGKFVDVYMLPHAAR